ncbi:AAA family ATPase [Terrisporobacter petrolearius]|uniref:AAA family ATPase n=1 Tax=Terrisporobacter petrolearius TaxID=1460447 RepID=UPI003AFFB11F
MQASYSRISCFNHCKQQYKYRYLDKLKLIPNPTPDNALIIGNTLHLALETNLEDARKFYYAQYNIINDKHIEEFMKIEIVVPKVKLILEHLNIYSQEFLISTSRFKGIVDLIVKNDDGTVDVFDFKYSNNVKNYLESAQLHIYKYFLEQKGFKVRKLGFIFVPKWQGRIKNTEDIYHFRKRLIEEVNKLQIQIAEVKYDPNKVIYFMSDIVNVVECNKFEKNTTKLCDWCDYQNYCLLEDDLMILPSNTRRERKIDENPDMWIYADSYVGKSTFVDNLDDLLFLNTDGNTDNTTSPVLRIADVVTTEGRITKRKLAWEVFLEVIAELEKKNNDFKRVCIDLVEDLYEHCRVYTYNKLDIQHEQDAGFGKGWDMVKMEFLKNIKRLKNLGYQIIYISKETSNEITLKNGSKYSTYKPNIQEKVANVLAGTVDLTVRAYVEKDKRYIQLAKDENTFGGGRFNFLVNRCELNMEEFKKALVDAQKQVNKDKPKEESKKSRKAKEEPKKENQDTVTDESSQEPTQKEVTKEEQPQQQEEAPKEVTEDAPKEEDKPKTRRRRKKKEEPTQEINED